MTLRLDYSNMMISPGGIDQASWSAAGKRFGDAKRGFDALRTSGKVGFVDLPDRANLLDQVTRFTAQARGKYDDVVILGIGGAAPGPNAVVPPPPPGGGGQDAREKRRGCAAVPVVAQSGFH